MSLAVSNHDGFNGINFKKMLSNLARSWDGTELVDWLKELIDNGIDASKGDYNDKIISLYTQDNKIIYEDNMNGMNKKGLNRLVEFFTDDQSKNEHSIGRFGIGAKKAILALIDISSRNIYSKNNKSVTIISKQNHHTISIKIDYSKINTLSGYEKMLNENFNNDADKLWNKYVTHSQSSGTIIIIETSNEMIENINMINNTDDYELDLNYRLFNISRTYNIYIKEGLSLYINNYKVPVYVHDTDTHITHSYEILIKKNYDGSYIYETVNRNNDRMQCKKKIGKYTNSLEKVKDADGFGVIGNYTLRCSMDIRHESIENVRAAKFNNTEVNKKFRKFVQNITNNKIEEDELVNMYYEYLKESHVIRGYRYLGSLPMDAPHNLSEESKDIFNLISKKISFTNRMDGILKLTQSNKSNITWKGTLPAFKRMTYLVINLFRKEYVVSHYKSIKSNLNLSKTVNSAIDMTKEANIYIDEVMSKCNKYIIDYSRFYDMIQKPENTHKIITTQSLFRKKLATKQYKRIMYKKKHRQAKIQTFTKNVCANKIIKRASKFIEIKRTPYKRIRILSKKIKKLINKPKNKITERDQHKIQALEKIFKMWDI